MAPRRKATPAPTKRKRADVPAVEVSSCPATGLRGAIHLALMNGDYSAYVGAWTAPYPPLPLREFAAAALSFHHLETALIGGAPLRKWQRDALLEMGAVASVVDTHDDALERLLYQCESLIKHLQKDASAAQCALIPRMLGSIRDELGSVKPGQIAEFVRRERRKRQPGPACLAAAIWTAAGLRGRGGDAVDNKAVTAAASRARKRRREGNADA